LYQKCKILTDILKGKKIVKEEKVLSQKIFLIILKKMKNLKEDKVLEKYH
jgi:hypothetical protein